MSKHEIAGMTRIAAFMVGLAIGSTSAPPGASAMDYTVSIDSKISSVVIGMDGPIERGDADRFVKFIIEHKGEMQGSKHLTFLLSSIGGVTAEAFEIADLIAGKRIVVPDTCMSACFYVLMYGREKIALKGAVIGVHNPSPAPGAIIPPDGLSTVTALYALRMRAAHVPDDIIVDMVTTGNKGMHVLTADQLTRMGVETVK